MKSALRRRRRRAGPAVVNVAASGGSWAFTPGAGTLTDRTATLATAAVDGEAGFEATAGTSGVYEALVAVGNTEATLTSSVDTSDGVEVVLGALNGDSIEHSISGRVKFTSGAGAVTVYVLLAQTVSP